MSDFLESTNKEANEAKKVEQESSQTAGKQSDFTPPPKSTADITDKISDVAQKSLAALKTSMDQMTVFASGAKKLGELKLELHHLKADRDKLFRTLGLRCWRLRQDNALETLPEKFAPEFERLAALDKRIVETEQRIQAVSLKK